MQTCFYDPSTIRLSSHLSMCSFWPPLFPQPGGDTLKLAFDTQEQAEEWHTAFQDAIDKQSTRKVA